MASPTASGASNSTASVAATALRKANQAKMQAYNQKIPYYYAVSMIAVIALFTLFHWSRFLYNRYDYRNSGKSKVMVGQVKIARIVRKVLIRPTFGFISIGHAVLVLVYLAINIILTVTNVDWSSLSGIAKRLGWMAIINIAFITFLALKNTPLAFLTAYSYERLNILHQIAGYVTIVFVLLHATVMANYFRIANVLHILLEPSQIAAITAGSAIFINLLMAILVRRIRYEVFYVAHITLYMLILITVGLHRPDFSLRAVIVTVFAGAIWFSDRMLRGFKIIWYSFNNTATITPLSNGGTRIILRRSPSRAIPGTHCFLWIPGIRAIETHPFTIVSAASGSLELVVAAHDGFTNDLHRYALKHPGVSLYASIDGPYGAIPNFTHVADKVILVAGGSGATFTFSVAIDMVNRLGASMGTTIDFIWAVKEAEYLMWFSKELEILKASPLVALSLYSTRSPNPSISSHAAIPSIEHKSLLDEKLTSISLSSPISSLSTNADFDVEKQHIVANGKTNIPSNINILHGRPDIHTLINEIVKNADAGKRIMIAACGPDGLMRVVRKTAADCISVDGPSIELHCEQFGW
ncbi:hypothetical protein B7494_g5317 [Chlorociboria aeruginascens]|nr:hypothetical protein B7494_g5317 [Chlorociboria aeruginascens]